MVLIIIEGEDLLISVFLNLDFYCSCGVQAWNGHLVEIHCYSAPACMPSKEANPAVADVGSGSSLAHQDSLMGVTIPER